ncbi:broad-specificity NMP kinase [Labedella gwakjiensis]|uniref:ATPase n=1 Tax=Labedella gwakjiensis TaxID=390269 RepID=A0A2P8GVQ4_9MICO|nr:AAA family ATPase [Labedella gwakjiensis]PSL38051.1 broad-specificity NMP kinase [Labedella gwakjiensis]RUQ87389.1 ATPase [Labedella gwakjiensis]
MRTELLLIGGASGVGKTTAALALHEHLKREHVMHAVIEGDYLDLAEPAPHEHFSAAGLAERNLAAVWGNYRELGYRRLVLTNTVSVLFAADLAAAMGDEPRVTAVLLRADVSAVAARLAGRPESIDAEADSEASARSGSHLDGAAGNDVHRLDTDGLSPDQVADRLRAIVGW